MPGTDAATVAVKFKNAFFAAAQGLFDAEVHVCFGHPGTYLPDDIVSFGRWTVRQETGPMTPNRARDETVTVDVLISIFRAGGPEMEQIASDRGAELLRQLEEYVGITDTTVAGTVRECFLTDADSDGESDPSVIDAGRTIEIRATFTAKARIVSNRY